MVENNTNAYINVLSPDANERGILFGDPTFNADGGIVYNSAGTPDGLQLRTNGNATRMVVGANGNVGIGNMAPNVALDVIGSIEYTGTITDVSDERLKENIEPLAGALEKVRQLDGVCFNMKDTPDQREVGLIAQNVQEVLPEAVHVVDPDTGHLGVSYPSLIPLIVEAIKEMQAEKDVQIAAQQKQIEELTERLGRMETMVDRLTQSRTGGAERQW